MKKKLLHISFVCVFVILLVSCLTFAVSAVGSKEHRCTGGFDPIVDVKADRISILGCRSCNASFLNNYPYAYIKLESGAELEEDNYTIQVKSNLDCAALLYGTDDEIIVLYTGRGTTVYPLSETEPTEAGEYSVMLSTKKLYNYFLETGKTSYTQTGLNGQSLTSSITTFRVDFTLIHVHRPEYYTDGSKLCVKCKKCGETGSISLDVENKFCVGHFDESDVPLVYDNWNELTYGKEDAVILYEGRREKIAKNQWTETVYTLSDVMPTEEGIYSVSLVLKSAWESNPSDIEEYRTNPIAFSIDDEYHKWEYEADGFSITAKCKCCDATASVHLDSSAVYENARQLDTDGLKQELFSEENWNSYKNISDFSIIYDGKEIYDTDNGTSGKIGTIRLYSSTIAPENSGNYVAYLAILKNPNDITSESIIVKSEGMPFYVAGYSFSRCEVLEYGENEITLFTKPSYVDGVYYVGTQSELLWCVYNQTTDMNITLTNDIVVNPITVTENGNISSGALVIYKWYGFGTASAPFSGTIDGNGHTIYGVYMPESLHGGTLGLEVLGDAGFICYGKNATVRNLSIESSYFNSSSSAGAFFGTLEVTDVARLETCRSVYNLVTSDRQAGGFIGWVTSNSSVSDSAYYLVHGCINYSYVTGNVAAGGIIGKTSPTESALTCYGSIYYCFNYGKITATDFAAGIVGSVTVWHHIGYNISYCLNAGTIKTTSYESGIIGELNTNGNGGALKKECVEIWHNVNIGGLNSGCKNAFDIIAKTGNNDYYEIGLLKLDDNYYSKTKSAYPTDLTGAPTATKLTANDVKDGTVCELLMGHIEDSHYSNVVVAGCETDGSKELCCSTCGKVLKTVTTSAHGHYYDALGNCIYCSNDKTGAASIFSPGAWIAGAAVVIALIGAGVAAVIVKKKKNAKAG